MLVVYAMLILKIQCQSHQGQENIAHSHIPIVFLSIIILSICCAIIWLNQRKASINFKRCQVALKICEDVGEQDSRNSLVYVCGYSHCEEPLIDEVTGVTVSDSLLLIRTVQVRQRRPWKNTNKTVDVWCKEHETDNHNDPDNWILQPMLFEAQRARLENYQLTSDQINLCRKRESVPVKTTHAENLRRWIGRKNYSCHIRDDYIYVTRSDYLDNLGCMRIKYETCPVGPMTVVASLSNSGKLVPFQIARYIADQEAEDEVKDMVPKFLRGFVEQKVARTEDINIVVETHANKQNLIQQHFYQRLWPICTIRLIGYTILVSLVYIILVHIVTHHTLTQFVKHHNLDRSLGKRFVAAALFSVPFFLIITAVPWITYYKPVGCCLFILGAMLLLINSLMVIFGSLRQYEFIAHHSVQRHFYEH